MTTLEELVELEPDPTHGYVIQRPASSGEWRFVLELADPLAGEYVTWHDITQFYVGDRYQRGADQYMGRYAASVATVQLQTDDDMLAPWGQDTSSLFGENIELDAGLLMRAALARVVSSETVEWQPIWTGRVESWGDASASRGQIRTHIVTVVDTITGLVNVPVPAVGVDQNWDVRVEGILTNSDWLFGVDIYGDDTLTPQLPARAEQASAITELDASTDPMGLVWRSRRNGRLVVHPAPFDTLHGVVWPNPTTAAYPDGLVFDFSPDLTDIEYIADDDLEPFGIPRTTVGVVNSIVATFPGPTSYPVDDPTSISKFGVRPLAFTWIVENEAAVDQLLAARAYATPQALPLRTSIDHEGFWPAMVLIDHLDPITIVHATSDTGIVVTATGRVRNVLEERTFRAQESGGDSALSWQSTVQADIDSTATSDPMLPVEDLALESIEVNFAVFSWTNPTQTITPTDTQVRILGKSPIWMDIDYPVTLWMSGVLQADTAYTIQVRLVRKVNGVITNASPVRELDFAMPPTQVPEPVPDGEDTDVDIPDPGVCELELELQENAGDSYGWVTIETWDDPSDFVDNGDGTYSLAYPVPNSTFENDKIYRFRSREVCDGTPGDWVNGPSFDPPDNWTDPCPTPPALSDPPYDDADMIVYVPKVCEGDHIFEYVSGIEGVKGSAYEGLWQNFAEPDRLSLMAVAQPAWDDTAGGLIAYGDCPQIVGVTGDKTIMARVLVHEAEDCVLFSCAAMRLDCVATTDGWRASVTVFKPDVTVTLPTVSVLDEDVAYYIAATHELATGDIKIYVDSVEDNSVGGTDDAPTINALPIWRVGAPPESWITDCAVWDKVLSFVPPFDPVLDIGWHCAYWAEQLTDADAASVTSWPDGVGSDDLAADPGSAPVMVVSDANFNNHRSVRWVNDITRAIGLSAVNHSHVAAQAQPYTLVVLAKYDSLNNDSTLIDGGGVSNRNLIRLEGSSGEDWAYFAGTLHTGGVSDTNPHCFLAYFNGASSRFEVDGSTVMSGSTIGTQAWDGLLLGYGVGASTVGSPGTELEFAL